MAMPMPYASEWTEALTSCFKPEVLAMPEYNAPPAAQVAVKLNQNESPDAPESDSAGVRWNRYPSYRQDALITELARYSGVDTDQILLGNGSNSLLYVLASAILEKDDAVVMAEATFSLYETVARLHQGQIVRVLRNQVLAYDSDAMIEAASRAKWVIIASPDNPTGVEMAPETVAAICDVCPGFVLIDEAYGEFGGKSVIPLMKRHANLMVLKTFSKALALGGARLGWLMARPEAIGQLNKAAVPYAVDELTARLALKALANPELLARRVWDTQEQRQRLCRALTELGITVFDTQTNFLLCRFHDADTVYQTLQKQGILVRDVQSYAGLTGCLRITVGNPEENSRILLSLQSMLPPRNSGSAGCPGRTETTSERSTQ